MLAKYQKFQTPFKLIKHSADRQHITGWRRKGTVQNATHLVQIPRAESHGEFGASDPAPLLSHKLPAIGEGSVQALERRNLGRRTGFILILLLR